MLRISRRLLYCAVAIPGCLAAHAALALPTVTDPGQGVVPLSSGATGAAELSGISYTGGTSYQAVGSNGATSLWTVSISVDPASGSILSTGITGSISAPGMGTRSEGVAFRASTGSVFVADAVASTITEFGMATGSTLGSVSVPAIYAPANIQSGKGLKSLAYGSDSLWTANEEALVPDGPLSTTTSGSWVRIQRFDQSLAATGQWGYLTDPITAQNPFVTTERSGVVDILSLSDTTLLVLEREFGGAVVPTFRSRLYLVDTADATDVSAFPTINAGGFTPLNKNLLWETDFGTASNFEAMTLGPSLNDGARSLVLVSDNGGGLSQNLYALTIAEATGDTLTVTLNGSGSGRVDSVPAGIACPGDCTEAFLTSGTLVDLQPTAHSDSSFTGWSDDCTGEGACQVAVTGNRVVTASFEPLPACAGGAVIVNSTDFTVPGSEVKSDTSIDTRGVVTIAPTADLTLRAPHVGFESGFSTETGGQLAVISENPGCATHP